MTETIQQLKENIALLQMKLQKLEELQRTKSPAEEAFRKVYYRYPDKLDDKYGSAWDIFEKGYNASKATEVEPSMINCVLLGNPPDGYVAWNMWYDEVGSKGILHNLKISSKDYKVGEYQPTPQEPEEEPEELKTLYQMFENESAYGQLYYDDALKVVKRWMSQYTCDYVMCGEYLKGYEECLTVLGENLK